MRLCVAALRLDERLSDGVVALTAEQIRERAPKLVTKPETMNYRTMLPEPGGFFDPKLFGPGTVIDAPLPGADEVIKPRKTYFARIPLSLPILHPLLVTHAAAELGEVLGKPTAEIIAAAASIEQTRALVEELEAAGHGWVALRELPVLPPDLRALSRDEHDRWVMTPLNLWYQRVLTRNLRIAKLVESNAPPPVLDPELASLREAIHGLFENDESPRPVLDADGAPQASLRSLCGGTLGLERALSELASSARASSAVASAGPSALATSSASAFANDTIPARHYIAKAVLFAMGFDLRH